MVESQLPDPSIPPPPAAILPTMYDLPSEDPEEPGLPDEFHAFQPQLLRETCQPPNYPTDQVFVGTDLNLYYDSRHPLWHKRPDWFLVLGVSRAEHQQDLRLSYVIWIEGVAPYLVVELLSPGTEAEDLGQTLREVNQPPTKWQAYEQVLRIPYYVVFDRYTNQLQVFQLVGMRYQAVPTPNQRFWFEDIELGLGVWQGRYENAEGAWLRWYDADGNWVENATEAADRATEAADRAIERADRATERADHLAAKLRELGLDPEQL